MGFLKRIKEQKEMIKGFKEMLKADQLQRDAFLNMNADELYGLSDEDLYTAAADRIDNKLMLEYDFPQSAGALSDAERIFYICQYFDAEVNNGGLCQYFVNSSRYTAPELSASLAAVGAREHQRLFNAFVKENHLDLNDFDSFDVDSVDDYAAQTERYPFDDFDDQFSGLPPLETILASYVREHINDFI